MAARMICPACRREIPESSPWLCPFCEHVLDPRMIGGGPTTDEFADKTAFPESSAPTAIEQFESLSEPDQDTLTGDEPDIRATAEALIVGDLDDQSVIDAPTFIPGKAKSYLFYGSGSWKENVRAILDAPASSEPVYPSEMTADDLGIGVDPDDLGEFSKAVDVDGDTLRIEIPVTPPPKIEAAVAPAPEPPPPPPPPPKPKAPDMDLRSRKLYEQAELERQNGDVVAAHRNVKLALTFDPKNRELKRLLGELARAIPKDRKAVIVSPSQALSDRAAEREREGDVDGAIELLERALRTQKDAAVYNRLGVILAIRKKDFDRGRAMVEKALDISPDNETYRHNLSKILAHAATRDLQRRNEPKDSGGIFGIFGKKK